MLGALTTLAGRSVGAATLVDLALAVAEPVRVPAVPAPLALASAVASAAFPYGRPALVRSALADVDLALGPCHAVLLGAFEVPARVAARADPSPVVGAGKTRRMVTLVLVAAALVQTALFFLPHETGMVASLATGVSEQGE